MDLKSLGEELRQIREREEVGKWKIKWKEDNKRKKKEKKKEESFIHTDHRNLISSRS